MSDVPTENAISRAEAAQQSGDFDAAKQALRNLPPGLDADHLMARNNLAALVADAVMRRRLSTFLMN